MAEEETLEHWPTERMITEGWAEFSIPEDLEGLPDEKLVEIATLCQVDQYSPDECIPCLAHVTLMERREAERERLETLAPQEVLWDLPGLQEALDQPMDTAILTGPGGAPFPDFGPDGGTPDPRPTVEEVPVVERFAQQVGVLQGMVATLLDGPPIPPPGVSLEELGALVVGASRWLQMLDDQGLELAPAQQAVRAEISRVVAKVRRG